MLQSFDINTHIAVRLILQVLSYFGADPNIFDRGGRIRAIQFYIEYGESEYRDFIDYLYPYCTRYPITQYSQFREVNIRRLWREYEYEIYEAPFLP